MVAVLCTTPIFCFVTLSETLPPKESLHSQLHTFLERAQDLVLLTGRETEIGSNECAPPVAAIMDEITDDNHDNIPTTFVDPIIKASEGKTTTRSVLRKEEFNVIDLISYMRAYLEAKFRPSAIEQLLEPFAKADPTLVGALIETELQGTSRGDLFNNIVDFDSNGDKFTEIWTKSAHRFWLGLKVGPFLKSVYIRDFSS